MLFQFEEDYRECVYCVLECLLCVSFRSWGVSFKDCGVSFKVNVLSIVWNCGCSFKMGDLFRMRVCVCACMSFRVCVCCAIMCGLWCPNIEGGVSVGAQGGGGCRRVIPDRDGVSWWCLGIW